MHKQNVTKVRLFYRPPDSKVSWTHKFETMTDLVTLEDKETIFLGDFNVDLIKYETNLKYLHEVYQFEQLISEPTRVAKNTSILIDHIYTTRSEMNRESGVIPLGLSDHHMVYMIRKYKHPKTNHKHTEINYRSYKSFNAEAFQQDLQQVPWSILDNIEDPNDNWTTWKSFFFAILDKHAPQQIRRIRTDSDPWVNDTILTAMQERNDKHEQTCRFNMYVFLFLYSDRYILYYITILQVAHTQMIKAYPAPYGLSTTA